MAEAQPDFSKEADLLRRLRAATRDAPEYLTVAVIIAGFGRYLRHTYGDAVAADFIKIAMA